MSCKYLSQVLQNSTQTRGCTIYIQVHSSKSQNYENDDETQEKLNHCHVHLIPRANGDLETPDDIYHFIDGYDKEYASITPAL